MRDYGKQVIAALILLLGVQSALAGTLDTVAVTVENRTPEEQQRALGEALNQVLVRLSGLSLFPAFLQAEQNPNWQQLFSS